MNSENVIGGYRDYVIFIFGSAISLVTAILAVAINAAYRMYFEKYPFLLIFLCAAAIGILFKLFRRAIGLKLDEKVLYGSNVDEIQERFKDEARREHPDLQISRHFYSLWGGIAYQILSTLLFLCLIAIMTLGLLLVYIPIQFVLSILLTEGMLKLAESVTFLILLGIGVSFVVNRSTPLFESLEKSLTRRWRHGKEFIWNSQLLQLDHKECHVIFCPPKDQILIRFFDEEESLKVERKIRELGLECSDETVYF
jgi:hypothetical protein